MQWAFASRSCGMPLSGAAITSEKTAEASSRRFSVSLSLASRGVIARGASARVAVRIIRIGGPLQSTVEPHRGLGDTVVTAGVAPWPGLLSRFEETSAVTSQE